VECKSGRGVSRTDSSNPPTTVADLWAVEATENAVRKIKLSVLNHAERMPSRQLVSHKRVVNVEVSEEKNKQS